MLICMMQFDVHRVTGYSLPASLTSGGPIGKAGKSVMTDNGSPPPGMQAAPTPSAPGLSLLPGMPPIAAPARRTYLELEPHPAVVPHARRFTRNILTLWDLHGLADDAELIASELLTNAITATAPLAFPAHIALLITADPHHLLLLVWDASPEPPARQEHDDDAPSGRGLQIIEALGAQWGCSGGNRGKVVWAALTTQPSPDDPGQADP
jgi:hypothetical protein